MPPTGILHTEMDEDTLLELEIRQDLERLDLNVDDDDVVADNDDAEINNNHEPFPIAAEEEAGGSEEEGVPAELQNYISTIQKQRLRFEEELEECDSLINRAITSARGGEGDGEKAVVVYDEWKELEEEAARQGMKVEEYRKKLLQDIEDEPFELEEMDFLTDDAEFILPESHLDQVLKAPASVTETSLVLAHHPFRGDAEPSEEEEMVEKALKIARALEAEQHRGASSRLDGVSGQLVPVTDTGTEGRQSLDTDPHQVPAIAAAADNDGEGDKDGTDDRIRPAEGGDGEEGVTEVAGVNVGSVEPDSGKAGDPTAAGEEAGTVAVIHSNPLLEFEQYLREQFRLAEERFHQREMQLKQELEARREVEERLMLAMEEHKLQTLQTLQQEEQRLAHKKQECQKKLDQEIDKQQKVLEKELKQHEEAIATLSAQLEEDRYQLEKVQRAEEERVSQRNDKAATTIQRCYKGYRVRKLHGTERQALAERREQRKEEKQQQRIQEIEQEIQHRREEDERKVEEARILKEKEEREIEEAKRKREEEERTKKEEEERRKKEEAERKRRAEEEKKRKKEEEKRLKEEQERKRQEEEKKKREEEERKRKEEEERKRREEEEKKQQEEERRQKEEEDRRRKEEEERKWKEEEEDRRRKQEEEKKKQEEEQKRLEDERKRKEEEAKLRAEEEKTTQFTEREATEDKGKTEKEENDGSQRKEQRGKTGTKNEVDDHRTDHGPKFAADKEMLNGGGKNNVRDKDGQSRDDENEYTVSPVVVDLEPVNANVLPSSLEERRLAWMKNCLPWSKISNEPWKRKSATAEKVPRRPASAKKLPPLPENLILEAAKVASLRQVTTVELKDLPGHALSPLGACSHLKHVTLTRCGLIALDGLSQCRHLQCLDVQDNLIEFVDLKELGGLYTLNLAHNKLSSIHGLEGCTNLRWLDVAHNRLTKLGGLSPLRRLHTLKASHNQLVSTQGLEACPTLQHLDLSANYLTALQGMDKLPLLLALNAASNNLTQMPSLENNVLLQDLILRENSIGPDLDLSSAWLPLLFNLDLSQNIIEQLPGSAGGLFVLKRLDLAVNQITDISSFLPALSDSPRLEDLSLQGNAVLDEDNFWDNVKNGVPCLLCLNGQTVRSQLSVPSAGPNLRSFELMCLMQLQQHRDIQTAFDKDCKSVSNDADKSHTCDTYFKFCDQSFRTAVEHRYTHEYGELSSSSSAIIPNPPHTPKSPRPPSARTPRVAALAKGKVPVPTTAGGGGDTDAFSQGNVGGSSLSSHASSSLGPSAKNATFIGTGLGAAGQPGSSPSPVLSQKEKFDLALKAEANKVTGSRSIQAEEAVGVQDGSALGRPPVEGWEKREEVNVESRKPLWAAGDAGGHRVEDQHVQQPQLSAKDKFERALAGLPPTTPPSLPPVVASSNAYHHNGASQSSTAAAAEKKTNDSSPPSKPSGITADLVGDLMMSESAGLSRSALPNKFLEGDDDLDDLEELMEGLQFDMDGLLDLDQFDFDEDFLEKGWRPEDTPQMPQKIPPSTSSSSLLGAGKPPLPPVHTPTTTATLHSPAPHPPQPPGRPAQAWHYAEEEDASSHHQQHQGRVPPLVRPPSSVGSGEDSQAVTTGRARKEERLAEEWGFKDTRTAELMMQRANKMKYNAERRRKLSKLDPQQRLRLFKKLEEAKGVRAVRPPPARVLPRKEYFQAREEEALQRDMEKRMEYKTRAGRTFEWLHTQVGDHDISSSRINPGAGAGAGNSLLKTASDSQLSHHPSPSPHQGGFSPVSMDIESASSMASHHHHHQQAGRQQRHSLAGDELTLTGHSPLLPPIKTGSAPSQHSREREKMSWRTEPTEKSVGWGGGKKRPVRK